MCNDVTGGRNDATTLRATQIDHCLDYLAKWPRAAGATVQILNDNNRNVVVTITWQRHGGRRDGEHGGRQFGPIRGRGGPSGMLQPEKGALPISGPSAHVPTWFRYGEPTRSLAETPSCLCQTMRRLLFLICHRAAPRQNGVTVKRERIAIATTRRTRVFV